MMLKILVAVFRTNLCYTETSVFQSLIILKDWTGIIFSESMLMFLRFPVDWTHVSTYQHYFSQLSYMLLYKDSKTCGHFPVMRYIIPERGNI